MPRRRPAQLRADLLHRRPLDRTTSRVPGLSRQGLRAIAYLERSRLGGHAVSDALEAWSWFVRDPWHRLWDPTSGCGVLQCCPNPPEVRWILDAAAAALPPRDARVLRRQVAFLDDLW